jgi:GT2 family glycosyltransferase
MTKRVAAVIVNYNRADDTIACIRSLVESTYAGVQVLLIDNGSTDTSVASFRRDLSEVTCHETGRNLGFTGGCNFALTLLQEDPPEYVLLLNNDTLVDPGFLAPLVDAMEQDRTIGAAGGTICYHPETERVWYAGGSFSFWRGSGFSWGYGQLLRDLPDREGAEVTFISGCLLLVRMSIVRQIGLLDDRFCMYLEDADLCLRLLAAGHRLVWVRGARVYHKVHHAGNKPLPLYFSVRNRLLILRLRAGGWRRFTGMSYVLLTTLVKMMIWRFSRRDLYRAARFGIEDFLRGRLHEGRGFTVR